MKRFLLFSGLSYYPNGGWADLVGDFDVLAHAVVAASAEAEKFGDDWWHIVDIMSHEVVSMSGNNVRTLSGKGKAR